MESIRVIFRLSGINGNDTAPIMVQCYRNERVSDIIKKYRNKSGDNDPNVKFIFNAKCLNPTLYVSEAGIYHNSYIFVVKPEGIKSENSSDVKSENNDEINRLKEELKNAKKIIESKDKEIKNLENQLINSKNNYDYEISKKNTVVEFFQNKLKEVEKELENIKNNNFNINKEKMIKESQIAVINFVSSDQKVHYAISCLNSTIFAEIEEKLYKIFPEYRETNNTFLAKGKNILRFKTISENGIGDGFPVMLYQPLN